MQLLDESEASEDSDEDITESGEDQGNLEELNESEAASEKDSLQTT